MEGRAGRSNRLERGANGQWIVNNAVHALPLQLRELIPEFFNAGQQVLVHLGRPSQLMLILSWCVCGKLRTSRIRSWLTRRKRAGPCS